MTDHVLTFTDEGELIGKRDLRLNTVLTDTEMVAKNGSAYSHLSHHGKNYLRGNTEASNDLYVLGNTSLKGTTIQGNTSAQGNINASGTISGDALSGNKACLGNVCLTNSGGKLCVNNKCLTIGQVERLQHESHHERSCTIRRSAWSDGEGRPLHYLDRQSNGGCAGNEYVKGVGFERGGRNIRMKFTCCKMKH